MSYAWSHECPVHHMAEKQRNRSQALVAPAAYIAPVWGSPTGLHRQKPSIHQGIAAAQPAPIA